MQVLLHSIIVIINICLYTKKKPSFEGFFILSHDKPNSVLDTHLSGINIAIYLERFSPTPFLIRGHDLAHKYGFSRFTPPFREASSRRMPSLSALASLLAPRGLLRMGITHYHAPHCCGCVRTFLTCFATSVCICATWVLYYNRAIKKTLSFVNKVFKFVIEKSILQNHVPYQTQ